jgi:hypothetical protein
MVWVDCEARIGSGWHTSGDRMLMTSHCRELQDSTALHARAHLCFLVAGRLLACWADFQAKHLELH